MVRTSSWLAIGLVGVASIVAGTAHREQPGGQPGARQPGGAQPGADMGDRLVAGLKSIDGCLGVEVGRFQSGKSTIIAWFRDAEAARAWYNHATHKQMISMVGADPEAHKPLEHVKNDVPVMVVASITFTDAPKIEGIPLPISQIAIELYTPLPGGASINGRFAPDTVPVEHHKVLNK